MKDTIPTLLSEDQREQDGLPKANSEAIIFDLATVKQMNVLE